MPTQLTSAMLKALKILEELNRARNAASPYLQSGAGRASQTIRALQQQGLVEVLPGAPGHINSVMLTDAGRVALMARENALLMQSISTLRLSTRSHNALLAARIDIVGKLVALQPYELLKRKGIGETVLKECAYVFAKFGLMLGDQRVRQQEIFESSRQ